MTGSSARLAARLDAAGVEAVSFDLFGTLLTVEQPPDPAAAVAEALVARGIDIPAEWDEAYRTPYIETDHPLQEMPLGDHVLALLREHADSADTNPDPAATAPDPAVVDEAVRDAFDTPIQTRDGAAETIAAFSEHVPIAVLSNSSVQGLVERSLSKADIPTDTFEIVRASVDIGWRKPHEQTFARIADDLGVEIGSLVHVGDDSRTDGGADRAGAHAVIVSESGPLTVASILEAEGWPQ